MSERSDLIWAAEQAERLYERVHAENEELRRCLTIAHAHALQGGYRTHEPDDQLDMARVRAVLACRGAT